MRKNRSPGSRRRTSAQWARLIDEWRNSGLSAEEFAARKKLSPRTLTWWKWHLGSSSPKPALVPLEIMPTDEASDLRAEWELRSPSGHVLRVMGAIGDDDLAAVLRAMSASRAMR